MKEFLAGWIVFQLVIIGLAGTSMLNQIIADTYDCAKQDEKISLWVGAMIPLVYFVGPGADDEVSNYCNAQEVEHDPSTIR